MYKVYSQSGTWFIVINIHTDGTAKHPINIHLNTAGIIAYDIRNMGLFRYLVYGYYYIMSLVLALTIDNV